MYLKRILGNKYIPKLAKSPTEKISLLHLLEKELANHIVCEVCKKLHNLKDAAHFLLTHGRSPLETPLCIWDETLTDFHSSHVRYLPGLIFSTTLIKMARKQYLHDARCRQILDLISYDLAPSSRSEILRQVKERFSFSARDGHFIMSSASVLVPERSRTRFHFPESSGAHVCRHLEVRMGREGAWVQDATSSDQPFDGSGNLWSAAWSEDAKEMAGRGSGVLKCGECWARFRIDFKFYEGVGGAVFVNLWKDFGTGPGCSEWERCFRGRVAYPVVEGDEGFVGEEGWEFDGLLKEEDRGKVIRDTYHGARSWARVLKEREVLLRKNGEVG
ncbi:hypothetical protein HYFRA_00011104 [Hymenoscyphus fraxineus]|uniref:Uncharacterized protein n=1 Tax=Hymenoscyphus fraxineus TaxID=746836 RepID=A0A9N9L6H7_9HELO|nr:hypothetical protein HYFRA_00011104 [Hymenoscyphus fraxineus]